MKEKHEEEKVKGLEVGPPLWVESLMTREEWKARYKLYPSSTIPNPPPEFPCEFPWRKGMGNLLSQKEIDIINVRIDNLKKLVTE